MIKVDIKLKKNCWTKTVGINSLCFTHILGKMGFENNNPSLFAPLKYIFKDTN